MTDSQPYWPSVIPAFSCVVTCVGTPASGKSVGHTLQLLIKRVTGAGYTPADLGLLHCRELVEI